VLTCCFHQTPARFPRNAETKQNNLFCQIILGGCLFTPLAWQQQDSLRVGLLDGESETNDGDSTDVGDGMGDDEQDLTTELLPAAEYEIDEASTTWRWVPMPTPLPRSQARSLRLVKSARSATCVLNCGFVRVPSKKGMQTVDIWRTDCCFVSHFVINHES
jgi:hypothetical protein